MDRLAITCPNCRARYYASADMVGRRAKCRHCLTSFRVEVEESSDTPLRPHKQASPDRIEVACRKCGRIERLRSSAFGKARCTACGTMFERPDSSFAGKAKSGECDNAPHSIETEDRFLGLSDFVCPSCGKQSVIAFSQTAEAGQSRICRACNHPFDAGPSGVSQHPQSLESAITPYGISVEPPRAAKIAADHKHPSTPRERCPHCNSANIGDLEMVRVMGIPFNIGQDPARKCFACDTTWAAPQPSEQLRNRAIISLLLFLLFGALAAVSFWLYARLRLVPSRIVIYALLLPCATNLIDFVVCAVKWQRRLMGYEPRVSHTTRQQLRARLREDASAALRAAKLGVLIFFIFSLLIAGLFVVWGLAR